MNNTALENSAVNDLIAQIAKWHHDRNLVDGATNQTQFVKLLEEVGELAGNLSRQKDIRDDIGDIIVVLINLCEREKVSLGECLQVAYDDIKDRKGKMVSGCFVKESDL